MTPLLFGLAILAILLILRVFTKSQKQLPPGPRGLPILGNVLQLGAVSWLTFDRWKYEYGPIVYLNMAGQHIVVLNTKVAATELLERRSAIYSDRPRSIVGEYLGCQLAMPFARYGKLYVFGRACGEQAMNTRISAQYQPVQTDEAVILAHTLLRDTSTPLLSKNSRQELQITSNALDTLSNIAHRFTNALYPGAHLVEVLPILDYLPGVIAKWKRDAKTDFKRMTDIFEKYFDDSVRDENQRSSLCVGLANEKVATGLSDVEQAWVAGTIAVAAVETTSTTLSFFLYAMILHPNVQEQAQKELDRVVGRSRNPTFSDMPFLPYVRAIVKEVLRWQPAIPLAVPHVLMEDDWYEGYFIPKGTSCIPNVWSMNRDKEVYGADADKFRPERFLRRSESETGSEFILRDEYEAEDGHCAYGFGRRLFPFSSFSELVLMLNEYRVCIGRHVADNALFIDICTILWALRIEPKPSINATKVKRGPSKDILK
ncbi:cytochrome P450 [Gymnopus androsaceus JB14]|uniref:Cytochrome P450 n=1 Tax=Gymnopus androsaceus JB14 TaxID=1447944 RepID=A0A6A4GIR5_9AGAR|nr:cytochrome P450 [Gymnopus androsaceus JB14]